MTGYFNREARERSIVLQPSEQFDALGSQRFRDRVAAIATTEPSLWIVDMSAVDFVDSAGLFALVDGLRLARQRQCRLVIYGLKATTRLIFEIAQCDRVFEIYETYEDIFAERPATDRTVLAAA